MLTILLILIIIACCLLVVIILAQNPKGGGLSNIGAGASQYLGARQTADFLEKSTWYFGIGILFVVVITYFLTASPSGPDKTFKSRTEGAEAPTYAPTKPKPKAEPAKNGNSAPAQQQQGPNGQHVPAGPPVVPK